MHFYWGNMRLELIVKPYTNLQTLLLIEKPSLYQKMKKKLKMCSLFLPCFCPFHPGAQMLLHVTRIHVSCLHFYCTFKTEQGKAAAKNLNGKGTVMKLDAERERERQTDRQTDRQRQRGEERERKRERQRVTEGDREIFIVFVFNFVVDDSIDCLVSVEALFKH